MDHSDVSFDLSTVFGTVAQAVARPHLPGLAQVAAESLQAGDARPAAR